MVETTSPSIPRVSPAEARVAMEKSKRAEEALRKNNFDYGIALLLECCTADPYNLKYRQSLRQAEKNKFKDNSPNAQVVVVKTGLTRFRLWWAVFRENYQKALILAEQILFQNPWDVPTQLKLAKAFEGLELLDHALWVLDQARQKDPKNVRVNRALAQLFEKRGNFPQAIAFWEMVRKAIPTDAVAQRKVSDLAANHAIAKAFGGEGTETTSSAQQKALTGSGTLKALPTSEATAGADKGEGSAEHATLESTPSGPSAAQQRSSKEVDRLLEEIANDRTNPSRYLQLARLFRKTEQLDQACEVLKEGLKATNNYADLAIELADVELEHLRKQMTTLEEKIRKHPKDVNLQKNRAQLENDLLNRELELLRRRSERNPSEMSHHFEIGRLLLKAERIDEAIRELQTVRSSPRYQGQALVYLGYCFQKRNNWRLAQRNFEEALQHIPQDDPLRKEIMFNLAQGYADAGDLAQAVEIGCELANLDFAFRDIGTLLDDWQSRLPKE